MIEQGSTQISLEERIEVIEASLRGVGYSMHLANESVVILNKTVNDLVDEIKHINGKDETKEGKKQELDRINNKMEQMSFSFNILKDKVLFVLYGLVGIGILHAIVLVKNLFWR